MSQFHLYVSKCSLKTDLGALWHSLCLFWLYRTLGVPIQGTNGKSRGLKRVKVVGEMNSEIITLEHIFGCLETLNFNISLNFTTRPASIETKGVKSEGAQLRIYVDRYKISLVVFNLIV